MDINQQIEKDSSMLKFNPNSTNPREIGYSCIHKACATPSLSILAKLLKDTSASAINVDNRLKTAAQRAPKTYLSSFKIILLYERKHFCRNMVINSPTRPGRHIDEHEMDGDEASIIDIDCSNRSIPHEITESGKVISTSKPHGNMVTTSVLNSEFMVNFRPFVAKNSMLEWFKPIASGSLLESKKIIDNEDARPSIPVFKPTAMIRKEADSKSVTSASKMNLLSVKKIEDSEMMSDVGKEDVKKPKTLAELRKRLIDNLESPMVGESFVETPIAEQPLALKVKNYTNYSYNFNLNKSLLTNNVMFSPQAKTLGSLRREITKPQVHSTETAHAKQSFHQIAAAQGKICDQIISVDASNLDARYLADYSFRIPGGT